MLLPFVGCFNIIMVTDFPLYLLSNTIVYLHTHLGQGVVNSLGACITEPTTRVCRIVKNISLKIFSEGALILCGNIKPFGLYLKRGTSQLPMGTM